MNTTKNLLMAVAMTGALLGSATVEASQGARSTVSEQAELENGGDKDTEQAEENVEKKAPKKAKKQGKKGKKKARKRIKSGKK